MKLDNVTGSEEKMSEEQILELVRQDELQLSHEDLNYNRPTPYDIDLSFKPIHYHDNDTLEIYKSYQRISEIIQNKYEASKNSRSRTINLDKTRALCQTWLDDIRYRQDVVSLSEGRRSWFWDSMKYFFKGKLRERKRFLATLSQICIDMSTRLDEIDGGTDAENNHKHLGF